MEAFEDTQARILRERKRLSDCYPSIWKKLIQEWSEPSAEDRLWLTYSANYLLRTQDVRWAIDPFSLQARLPSAPEVDIAGSHSDLSFILLTHIHADHFDSSLIKTLRYSSTRWIVPDFLLAEVEALGVPDRSIEPAEPGRVIQMDGVCIQPFAGQHFHTGKKGTVHGVPEMGYLVSQNGRRWLFPGDTRNYDISSQPRFDAVDAVIAHVWLGRNEALVQPPGMLEPFCQFCAGFDTKRIILTHFNEIGRDARDYWTSDHFQLIRNRLSQIRPEMDVVGAFTGESILLAKG